MQNPAPFQNRDSIGNPVCKWLFPASLVPPWCLAGCPIDPFLPPWCLPGCPNGSFLPPWCLPGASLAVRWILSCLPGASRAVQRVLSCLPGASQAVQMDLSCLPGASLSKAILCSERHFKGQSVLRAANRGARPRICREPGRSPLKLYLEIYKIRRSSKTGIRSAILRANGSFLPPWCLPGGSEAVQLILSCLPGASQAVQMVLSYLPGASLVPRWLSDGSRGWPRPVGPRSSARGARTRPAVFVRRETGRRPACLARGETTCMFCSEAQMQKVHEGRSHGLAAALERFRAASPGVYLAALSRVRYFLGAEAAKAYAEL